MGVTKLLPLLSSITIKSHFLNFKNKRIAIDVSVLLHKGTYSCAYELLNNIPTNSYINYVLNILDQLILIGINIIVVFDGLSAPMKNNIKNNRAENRNKYLELGKANLSNKKLATEYFQKAVIITPEMVYKLICRLKEKNIKYIVSPYEADSQLAYLQKSGSVDYVMSEDSDILVFGCTKLIVKVQKDWTCDLIDMDLLKDESYLLDQNKKFEKSSLNFCKILRTLDIKQLILTCCLSGCDYCEGINGIGLIKALNMTITAKSAFEARSYNLGSDWKVKVAKSYLAFHFSRVFTLDHKLVYLNDLTPEVAQLCESFEITNLEFLGPELDPEFCKDLCSGLINTSSLKKFHSAPIVRSIKDKPKGTSSSFILPKEQKPIVSCFIPIKKSIVAKKIESSNESLTSQFSFVHVNNVSTQPSNSASNTSLESSSSMDISSPFHSTLSGEIKKSILYTVSPSPLKMLCRQILNDNIDNASPAKNTRSAKKKIIISESFHKIESPVKNLLYDFDTKTTDKSDEKECLIGDESISPILPIDESVKSSQLKSRLSISSEIVDLSINDNAEDISILDKRHSFPFIKRKIEISTKSNTAIKKTKSKASEILSKFVPIKNYFIVKEKGDITID